MSTHPWEREQGYMLVWDTGVQPLPASLKIIGPTRSDPAITFDRPPGAPAGSEFALGDGQSTLQPLVFKGLLNFRNEAEKDLYVAQMDEAASLATVLERMEKSGPIGRAPGWARWTHGDRAISGELTVTLYPTARPTINGIPVDW